MERDLSVGSRFFRSFPRYLPLAGLGAAALALRLVLIAQIAGLPVFHARFSDTRIYFDMAARLLDGTSSERAFFMSPLYPVVIAGVQFLVGDPALVLRLLQALAGATTVVLVQRIGQRMVGAAAGWIAATWAAVHPILLWHDASLLSESLLTLLAAFAFLLMLLARDHATVRRMIVLGVVSGLLVIGRSTFVLLPLLVVAVALWDHRRSAALPAASPARGTGSLRPLLLMVAVFLVTILPVTLHNLAAEGRLIPVVSSLGFNLYAGNNASCDGGYTVPERIDLVDDPGGRFHAELATGRSLRSDEVSAFWFDRATTWITSQPGAWLRLLARKSLLLLRADEIEQIGFGVGFIRHAYATVLDLPLPGFLLLLPLGAGGIALALGARVRHAGMFALLLLLASASIILFFVNGRFRLPITPLLLVFAGHALVEGLRLIRVGELRRLAVPAICAFSVLLLSTVAQPALSETFELEYTRLGQMAFDRGDYDESARLFEHSLREKETVDALVNLGNAHAVRGRAGEAGAAYDRALSRDPHSHRALFNLGNLAMQSGNERAAFTLWSRALASNGTFAPAHRNLGLLLVRSGRIEEGRAHLRSFLMYERDARARADIARDLRTLESLK